MRRALLAAIALTTGFTAAKAQTFGIEKRNDSLYVISLVTDRGRDEWRLEYPVYRFCTGDVDGDGRTDVMVGVVKATRYYPEKGRRLFIFKNADGQIRPLWMGSKLGGRLMDFRFTGGVIRSLEQAADGIFMVGEYRWAGFGMTLERLLADRVDAETAARVFEKE